MSEKLSSDVSHQHHSTWVEHVIVRIEDAIHNINFDFPLSGGDEPALHTHHSRRRTEEELQAEREKWAHRLSFLHPDLNKEYPLSGGE